MSERVNSFLGSVYSGIKKTLRYKDFGNQGNNKEIKHQTKWRQYIAGATASLSLVALGAWFSSLTPLLPRLLGPDSPVPMTPEEASWIASSIEIGCLLSPIPSMFIADRFGRKICMLLCVPLYFIALLLINYVRTVGALIVARIFTGAGGNIGYTILPLYLGEIASPEVRGTITGFFNISCSLGFLFSYVMGPLLSYEVFNYATFSISLIFMIFFIWQPESPYFYAMKENSAGLTKSLRRLRDSPSEDSIESETKEIQMEITKHKSNNESWLDLFATPEDRRALLLVQILSVVCYSNGHSAILTYMTETFSQLPSFVSADVITVAVGISNLLGSILNMFISDRFGRRFLLLTSSIGCTISQGITSLYFFLYFELKKDVASYSWIAQSAVICFNFLVNAGMMSVLVIYSSELFPTKTRGMASSVTNLTVTVCSFLVIKLYEPISLTCGIYFMYLVYSVTCLIGTFLFYFMMPETKGKTFMEIRDILIKTKSEK